MTTKIALTVLGLATLVATPAFAQKPTHHAATGPPPFDFRPPIG
jgi:hypothetical protein